MRLRLVVGAAATFAVLLAIPAVGAGSAGGSAASAGPVKFLTGPAAGSPLDIALSYLKAHKRSFGLTGSDLADVVVSDQYTDAASGTTHIYLQQRHKAIDVYNAITDINVAKDGSIINVGNRFVSNLAASVNSSSAGHGAKQGVRDAARGLGLDLKQEPKVEQTKGGPARETVFNRAGISLRSIPAKLVYVPTGSAVRLAWNVAIYQTDAQHWWNANVDASTGEVLTKSDYVDHESYNVFAPPKESPLDGGRTLEVNRFDTLASPFGWHDTDGAPGAESTLTIGNNVHAATDLDANNLPDPGSEPNGGPGLLFDSPLDLATQEPADYRPAAVTNLFFWNNYIHDVSYRYGFDEAAGNFQENDYGRGGLGSDSVNADAQDGSGLNNANFGTPPDGQRPRMQMYVWTAPVVVTVNSPAEIAGDYTAALGAFGPVDATGVTGDLEQPSPSTLGCTTADFAGFTAGHIALIDRGTCTFSTKIRNAQNAGAPAVIVANNQPGLVGMAQDGTPNQPTIPAVMITQANGTLIKPHLPGVNTTIRRGAAHSRDSDIDNGVIAHEYTHGISNRLTGGPSNVDCLDNAEEEGEGWSDFMALVLTATASQTGTTQRPIGAYVNFGNGIRSFPYTTDMSVNPQTYDAIKTNG
jgi:extracellular elastinolytic metalloproteinase